MRGIQIGETRHRRVELQFDGPRRAVALLADDHLGLAVYALALREPFGEFLAIGLGRFAHLMIVFFTEDEDHHVGVLFDRSRFTQIRQLRALVFTAFHLARQLRERQDWNVKFFGQRFESGGNFSDFLNAAFGGPAHRSL